MDKLIISGLTGYVLISVLDINYQTQQNGLLFVLMEVGGLIRSMWPTKSLSFRRSRRNIHQRTQLAAYFPAVENFTQGNSVKTFVFVMKGAEGTQGDSYSGYMGSEKYANQ